MVELDYGDYEICLSFVSLDNYELFYTLLISETYPSESDTNMIAMLKMSGIVSI